MRTLRWPRMSETEIAEFLGRGGTGVISFAPAADEPPYSLPVSYGYESDSGHFHFRLSFPPDSGKADAVDRPVTFVTYDETDDGWRSVVAKGELEELTDEPYDSSTLQERWNVSIPLIDVFRDPPDDVEFRQYCLDPDELTGRKEVERED